MNTNTITSYINEELQGKKVLSAIFTTYNFEPEFFETEIIPILFQDEKYYSQHPIIKRFQVKEELEKSEIDLEVFYDKTVFDSEETPQMEYSHHAITHPNGAFHAKLIYILFENEKGTKTLLLYAGSNNLSKAGWWDNIEAGNYILVDRTHSISQYTSDNIYKSLSYLKGKRQIKHNSNTIEAIEKFLYDNEKIVNSNQTYFYFQRYKNYTCKHLFNKVLYKKRPAITNLDIISPFFSDSDDSDLHINTFENKFDIKILLPKNPQGKILCTPQYYEHCKLDENVSWSIFTEEMEKGLEIESDSNGEANFRKLHGKIYHFYNENSSWFFTGSFNFSYQAFNKNIEAGFLYKSDEKCQSLLVENSLDPTFETNLMDVDNPYKKDDLNSLDVAILFDWDTKTLVLKSNATELDNFVTLTNSTGQVLDTIAINENLESESSASKVLYKYLEKNSYVYILGQAILVQHVNWKYKPNNFPPMSISEILSIYSSLDIKDDTSEQRYIMHLLRELEKQGALYESSTRELDLNGKDFFSEYAEIFFSFRKLHSALVYAKESKDNQLLEYYFRMQYPDSFASIIEKIETDNKIDITTRYLVALSIEEIYETIDQYKKDPLFHNLTKLKEKIKQEIGQEDFMQWFEEEFKYKHMAKGESNA